MSVTIVLDNYPNICYPGQTISGRLECDFVQEERLRAIRILFKGSAKTWWSESRGTGDSKESVHFQAEEDYFNQEYNLFGGSDDLTLPAGKHIYPFAYILPLQLPSACDLDFGHIHYKIRGTVNRPWKFDYECEFMLNVSSPLDLNYIPGLREPRQLENDKEVSMCCFQSGNVKLNASLPITGFAPGQVVNVGCYVQNLSNTNVTEVRFKIKAIFEFIVHWPHSKNRFTDQTIFKHIDGGIGAHGEKSWTANFTLPPEQFINLMQCSIMNVSYIMEVEAVLPLPHTNLTLEFPVMIGSIPLTGINATLPELPLTKVPLPQSPDGFNTPPILNASAPFMPGPNAPYPYEGTAPTLTKEANGLPTYNDVTKEKM